MAGQDVHKDKHEDFINRGISSKMPCKHVYALVMSGERFWDSTKGITQDL